MNWKDKSDKSDGLEHKGPSSFGMSSPDATGEKPALPLCCSVNPYGQCDYCGWHCRLCDYHFEISTCAKYYYLGYDKIRIGNRR